MRRYEHETGAALHGSVVSMRQTAPFPSRFPFNGDASRSYGLQSFRITAPQTAPSGGAALLDGSREKSEPIPSSFGWAIADFKGRLGIIGGRQRLPAGIALPAGPTSLSG